MNKLLDDDEADKALHQIFDNVAEEGLGRFFHNKDFRKPKEKKLYVFGIKYCKEHRHYWKNGHNCWLEIEERRSEYIEILDLFRKLTDTNGIIWSKEINDLMKDFSELRYYAVRDCWDWMFEKVV